jgi:hypothetical protein
MVTLDTNDNKRQMTADSSYIYYIFSSGLYYSYRKPFYFKKGGRCNNLQLII